jgi:hypothetical protein
LTHKSFNISLKKIFMVVWWHRHKRIHRLLVGASRLPCFG